MKNAATIYGPVSFAYGMTFRCASLSVNIKFHEEGRLPDCVAVRCVHPQKLKIRAVKLNGAGYGKWDAADSFVRFDPRLSGVETVMEIFY